MKNCNLFVLVLVLFVSGCGSAHYVIFTPKTQPELDWVYVKGQSRKDAGTLALEPGFIKYRSLSRAVGPEKASKFYEYIVQSSDFSKGKVQFPTLILEKRGYKPIEYQPPDLPLDDNFHNNVSRKFGGTDWTFYWHQYENSSTIVLQPDQTYTGPDIKNKITVVINSEPRGARIYAGGNYLGETPLNLNWDISNDDYERGWINSAPLIAVLDGYSSEEKSPKIKIYSSWKYKSGKIFDAETGVLFLLKRDSNGLRHSPATSADRQTSKRNNYCKQAQQDYNKASEAYNSAKNSRSSSRLAEGVGILGMLSPSAKDQALGSLYSRGGRNSANDSQADMNHALNVMQDAQNRMSIHCGN